MTPERWARIATLFEQAHSLSGDDQRRFLEGIASVDDRREVAELLEQARLAPPLVEADPRRLAERRLGTRIGKYRLEEIAGGGGQGWVYRAVHEDIGLEVAIKALPPQFSSDAGRQERLLREAQALATLDDESIARVHDVVREGDEVFLVTEFVRGQTLRQALAGGPLPLAAALDYAAQILHALEGAHTRGIVHRDLKPENVMVATSGRVKLLDFGLARVLPVDSGATRSLDSLSRDVVGTIAYMSPEQLKAPDVDRRSDLFSFGVLFYEMVSGVHPFGDPGSWSIVGRIERDDPTPFATVRRDLPGGLFEVVARCLRKRPNERFQSAADVAAALQTLSSGVGEGSSEAIRWWQFHQVAASVAYASMLYPAWVAFEVVAWRRVGLLLFFAALTAAVVNVTLRLYMCFAWRHYRNVFQEEWAWVAPVLFTTDVVYVGLMLASACLVVVTAGKPIGLAVLLLVVALAGAVGFLRIEPAASRAAFGESPRRPRLSGTTRFGSGRLGA